MFIFWSLSLILLSWVPLGEKKECSLGEYNQEYLLLSLLLASITVDAPQFEM
jgi:hypothetical protein